MTFSSHLKARIKEIEEALFYLRSTGREFPRVEESLTTELNSLRTMLKEEEARE